MGNRLGKQIRQKATRTCSTGITTNTKDDEYQGLTVLKDQKNEEATGI